MEKCHKCGNKLSYIDVLCPHCCAMVEKVPDQPSDLHGLRGKDIGESARSEGIDQQHVPKPSSFRLYSPSQIRAAQANRNTSFNSYADVKIEQPRHGGRSRSELHGAPKDLDTIVIIEDMPWHHSDSHNPPDEPDAAHSQATGETAADDDTTSKSWLEITEPEEETSRRYKGPYEPFTSTHTQSTPSDDEDMPERRYRRDKKDADYSDISDQSSISDVGDQPKKQPVLLAAVFWVLAAATLFGLFYMLDRYVASAYGSYPAFIRAITDGKVELDTSAALSESIEIEINETTTADGAPAHSFDVYVMSGTHVRVLPVDVSFDIENGRAHFIIADEALAKALGVSTSEASVVADNITLIISAGERQITKNAEPITLVLTSAAYTRHAPAGLLITTVDDTVAISIAVAENAIVYINNTNYTDQIGPDGTLAVTLPLIEGENTFLIDVRQMGYQTTKDSFTVVREALADE